MGKYSLSVMLFLLCSTFKCSSCVDILNIVTSPNSSCDGEFTCYTLQVYATDNPSVSDNITLELQPGTHYLDSSLALTGSISYFMMKANTTATVLCSPGSSTYFSFSHQQQVTVSGVSFIDCKMNLGLIARATFLRSSFRDITRNRIGAVLNFRGPRISVQIEECTFLKDTNLTNNNRAIRLYSGSMYIHNSNFSGFTRFPPMADHGGALYVSTAEVTIVNSYFCDNVVAGVGYGGAAVYITRGIMATISDSYFSNNTASGTGGAVYVTGGEFMIDNSHFYNNRADVGGIVYSLQGNLSVTNTYFIDGTAIHNGGAIYTDSGNLNITNSHFINNSAGYLGGAAAYCVEGEITIINSSFHNNDANTGGRCGAVCTDSGKGLLIFGSNFSDSNVADIRGQSGGALYINDSKSVSITNCSFNNNVVVPGDQNGGAIYVHQGEVTISNSYFIENSVATDSSYSGNTLYIRRGDMTIVHSYFCNENHESDYIYITSGGNITITNSYFIINETTSSRDCLLHGIISYQHNSSIRSITNISTAADHNSCGLITIKPTVTVITSAGDNNVISTAIISSISKETLATSEPTSESSLQTNPSTKEASESTTQVTSMVTTMGGMISTMVMSMITCASCRCCSCCPCCP